MTSTDTLQSIVTASPLLGPILTKWDEIALPNAWLAGGAVAQTYWNYRFGFAPGYGISDVDLVYFDSSDLSEATEAGHAERVRRVLALPIHVDVKNEARVHLWYEAKFGYPISAYASAQDAIDTFPTTATAIGLRPHAEGFQVYVPYGTADLIGLIVRANQKQIMRAIYEAKVSRWRSKWPGLNFLPWQDHAECSQAIGRGHS